MWREIWTTLCDESWFLVGLVVVTLTFAVLVGFGFGLGYGIYFSAYAITGHYEASVSIAVSIAGFVFTCLSIVACIILTHLSEPRYGPWSQ